MKKIRQINRLYQRKRTEQLLVLTSATDHRHNIYTLSIIRSDGGSPSKTGSATDHSLDLQFV